MLPDAVAGPVVGVGRERGVPSQGCGVVLVAEDVGAVKDCGGEV